MAPRRNRVEQRGREWFVIVAGLPGEEHGPYSSKDEAKSDLEGLVRFCEDNAPWLAAYMPKGRSVTDDAKVKHKGTTQLLLL